MRDDDNDLTRLVRSVVAPMGYEALGVEHRQRPGGSALLRVYIDHPDGIGLEDCEAVSRQLSAALDVADPIPGHYDLEVSSPGLDRPLFTPTQIAHQVGNRARFRLAVKHDGRRRFDGEILAVDVQQVRLLVDGEQIALPLDQIESARLVPTW
ncbi:MAG: ribosome maturation factor RimP [Chromatiaceae bacterium]|nr:MAG: ribosome maturation factor RimP [Chromatiaceae bacterium]